MKLMLGDCLEIMKEIPEGSIDFVLTDPPYGTTACKWDNVIPFEPMWRQIWRVLKPDGACALFGSEPFSSYLRMSQINNFKYDWVWHKNHPSGFAAAKKQPMRNHEMVSIFYKIKPSYNSILEKRDAKIETINRYSYGLKSNNRKTTNKQQNGIKEVDRININLDYRLATTVKYFKTVPRNKMFHPTQKPVSLLEYLIKTYALEGETVLDFTMGSGSTGVACQNLGREFIGIEKDPEYFKIAEKRLSTQIF